MTPSSPPDASGSTSLRPFRMGLAFGFFNAITWQIALGAPLVLLAEALGATAFQVGLIYSFLFLMAPVQVLSTALLPRLGYRKVMLLGWGARSLCLLVPIYLAWVRPPEPLSWHINLLILSVFFFAFLRSIGSSAFLPWMYSILPARMRGRYFANDQIFSGIAGVATLIGCSVLFFWLPLQTAFVWQYALALTGALLAWYALKKIPDGPRPEAVDLRRVARDTPRLCFRRSRYRHFLWLSVLFAVCSAPIAPFSVYYLRVEVGLDAAEIILFTTLQYLGAIVGSLFVRNIIDRSGPRLFFRISSLLYIAVALSWWSFLHWEAAWVLPLLLVYFTLGMAASAWMSANLNYLPRLTSERDRPIRISVHGAVTSFLGGLSPIVWGLFLRGEGDGARMNTQVFEIFFIILLLSHLLLLWHVRYLRAAKTDGEPILLAGGLGRPIRSLSSLVNLTGYRKKPK
jgi:MFS family permease